MGYQRELSPRQRALDLDKKKEAMEVEMAKIVSELTVRSIKFTLENLSHRVPFLQLQTDESRRISLPLPSLYRIITMPRLLLEG